MILQSNQYKKTTFMREKKNEPEHLKSIPRLILPL